MDIEQPDDLNSYLTDRGAVSRGEMITARTLAGGVSNKTVWVTLPDGQEWVIKQALAKLRVKLDWFSDPARLKREALGISLINSIIPNAAPELIFYDETNYILAMRAVPHPHYNWKSQLLAGNLRLEHIDTYARCLAAIHRETHRRLDELKEDFGDRSFFEGLRLEAYYSFTGEQIPEAQSFMQDLIGETRSLQIALAHGDYSPKNVLLVPQEGSFERARLILLDHETCHLGDPAFDIGFSMTHFLSKGHHLPEKRAEFLEAARHYWQVYRSEFSLAQESAYEARAARHLSACLLARIDGRSPLEYLDESERTRQRNATIKLIANPPVSIADLTARFGESLYDRD